jgi:hypothetical protein
MNGKKRQNRSGDENPEMSLGSEDQLGIFEPKTKKQSLYELHEDGSPSTTRRSPLANSAVIIRSPENPLQLTIHRSGDRIRKSGENLHNSVEGSSSQQNKSHSLKYDLLSRRYRSIPKSRVCFVGCQSFDDNKFKDYREMTSWTLGDLSITGTGFSFVKRLHELTIKAPMPNLAKNWMLNLIRVEYDQDIGKRVIFSLRYIKIDWELIDDLKAFLEQAIIGPSTKVILSKVPMECVPEIISVQPKHKNLHFEIEEQLE